MKKHISNIVTNRLAAVSAALYIVRYRSEIILKINAKMKQNKNHGISVNSERKNNFFVHYRSTFSGGKTYVKRNSFSNRMLINTHKILEIPFRNFYGLMGFYFFSIACRT